MASDGKGGLAFGPVLTRLDLADGSRCHAAGFSQFLLLHASVEAEVHDLASEFHGAIVRQGGALALPEEGPEGIQ